MILNINKDNYNKYINDNTPILVEFSAPWCVYCRRLAPVLQEVSEKYNDVLKFGVVNIDDEPDIAEKEKVEVIPTIFIYRNGKILGSTINPNSKNELEKFINDSLNKKEDDDTNTEDVYDMIIIGGGPAGYTCALYAARAGLKTIVLEKLSAGGQMALSEQIDNYPGFEDGITGFSLAEKMRKCAEKFGAMSHMEEVVSVNLLPKLKSVETKQGTLYGKTVVVATGANPRELGLANEKELVGKGVSYCAFCDGMFYRDKTVVVVGGGNSAAEDAIVLSKICKKVIMIHHLDTMQATKIYQDSIMQKENIEINWNSVVEEIIVDKRVTGVRMKNISNEKEKIIDCDGVFIGIGRVAATELVKGQLNIDKNNYIVADESTQTNIPGVFAVGDVRTKDLRQIVTAVSDGAVAVHYAEKYLTDKY